MRQKRIVSVLLLLVMLIGCLPMNAFALETGRTKNDRDEETVTVYVTIAAEGAIVEGKDNNLVAEIPVTVMEGNNLDDALSAVHEICYEGGSGEGYGSDVGGYGTYVTKLWGDTSGSFGYYVNNVMCMSLDQIVEDGDQIVAWVYKDQTSWTDGYSYFDRFTASVAVGEETELTLSHAVEWDENWNPVFGPMEGASVTVDGSDTGKTTDADGKVSLSFSEPGTYVVSAVCDEPLIVPAVCVFTVEAGEPATADVTIAISNAGVLALPEKPVVVVDLDGDGELTYHEALIAAHDAYYPGGAEAGYVTSGTMVRNLWGVDAGGNCLFVLNHEFITGGVFTDTVEDGDYLVAAVMNDPDEYYYTDYYCYFTERAKTVNSWEDFTLTLDVVPDWMMGLEDTSPEGLQVGVWDNGSFSPMATADENGNAELFFTEPGTYIISAAGTVYYEDWDMDCPIFAPTCEVTVVHAEPETVTAYVTIVKDGGIVTGKDGELVAEIPVTLMEGNNLDDALSAVHEICYEGGSGEGYGSDVNDLGVYITKLWGDTSGAFGYYVNNEMPMSLDQTVEDGDQIVAFVYQDQTNWSDGYAYFDRFTASLETGDEVELTLYHQNGYDPDTWLPVFEILPGAQILVNGEASEFATGEDGKVRLWFYNPGTYVVSAESDDPLITAPVCVITVTGDPIPEPVNVYVTIFMDGVIVTGKDGDLVAEIPLRLMGGANLDEALMAVHEVCYDGGAEAGYGSDVNDWGAYITKLWGDTSGAFGYYVNNEMPMSLDQTLADGDQIVAFIYQDQTSWSDGYAYFDVFTAEVPAGVELELTLSRQNGYDPDTWLPIFEILPGAVVTVDGEDVDLLTDENGKVKLSFDDPGRYVVSAVNNDPLIAGPVCVVTVSEALDIDLEAELVNGGVQLTWAVSRGGEVYSVYRKTEGGEWEKIGETSESSYKDTSVDVQTAYQYKVGCADGVSNVAEITTGRFLDVLPGDSYNKAVNWAVENGIVNGTSATTFSPKAACTRAQFALMLYRLAGKPEVDMSTNPFTDLPNNNGIKRAIVWAYNAGIVNGTSATTFSPEKNITRAQLTLMLYKMAGKPDVTGLSCPFEDLDGLTGNNLKAVIWAYNEGIVKGTGATTFSPKANCTRGQLVIMLYRFNKLQGYVPTSSGPVVTAEARIGSFLEA